MNDQIQSLTSRVLDIFCVLILIGWTALPLACTNADQEAPAEEGVDLSDRSLWLERADERKGLVERHLVDKGITNERVLEAMSTVPRHYFVPESHQSAAYKDYALDIGLGQTISQPYVVARMTEALQLWGGEKVLEIGTGSGYQAAILAEMGVTLFSIEIIEDLAANAKKLLDEMGYEKVTVRHGDGYKGWPEEAPFDAIIVTAAPDHIPQPLRDQLKIGGRLVLPVGDFDPSLEFDPQDLILITRTKDGFKEEKIESVRFVPMTGEAQEKE